MRLPSQLDQPIGFAHRGAKAQAPENTREAFNLAVEMGASGLESDVWLSADGKLVLNHDGHIGRRRKRISTILRADLPAEMLTLPELLDLVPEGTPVSIDVKEDAVIEPLLAWTVSLPSTTREQIFLCHPDWEELAKWRSVDPHVRLIDSSSLKLMDAGPERRAHQLAEAQIDGVNLRQHEWSGGMTTLFHRFERLCFAWDAQHGRIVEDLLWMGIDGVFSDHVEMMMTAIRNGNSSSSF